MTFRYMALFAVAICVACSSTGAPEKPSGAAAAATTATSAEPAAEVQLAAALAREQAEAEFIKRLLAAGKTSMSAKTSAACSGCCCASGSYGSCVNSKKECDDLGGACVDAAPGC